MGIRVLSRIAISCLGFGIAALSSGPASADYRQLQAVLAKYFIANHQAIPLHNNGKVKSGDVLKLPEEATYLSRDKCFDLPSVRYTSLDADLLVTTSEVAAEVGGEIPTDKLAKIEATVHGEIRQTAGIRLNPFAQEEPAKWLCRSASAKTYSGLHHHYRNQFEQGPRKNPRDARVPRLGQRHRDAGREAGAARSRRRSSRNRSTTFSAASQRCIWP